MWRERLHSTQTYEAVIDVRDADDGVSYRWELKSESTATTGGGDYEGPIPNLEDYLSDPTAESTMLSAPAPGKYRLFAYVSNEQGHVAHANIPFLVESETVIESRTVFVKGDTNGS